MAPHAARVVALLVRRVSCPTACIAYTRSVAPYLVYGRTSIRKRRGEERVCADGGARAGGVRHTKTRDPARENRIFKGTEGVRLAYHEWKQ